jgi:hypothetical protein
MNGSRVSSFGYLGLGLTGLFIVGACGARLGHEQTDAGTGVAQSQSIQPLSANDVSILIPSISDRIPAKVH